MWDIEHDSVALQERERNITEFEEQVLRCVHHEFAGMTQKEAAGHLEVSPFKISRALKGIEEKAKTCSPIRVMLPILTKRQFKIFEYAVKDGMSLEAIAQTLKVSVSSVRSALHKIRKKGMRVPSPAKHEQYIENMDDKVQFKF